MDTQSYFSKKSVQTLMTMVLVGAILALGAYANLTLKEARGVYTGGANITVSGEGEVLAKPDIGKFTFTVRAKGADATEAQDKSAEATNKILAFLEESGVEEKDIKTQHYNLSPNYKYEERVCAFGSYCPPGEPIIDGYEVSQSVEVKVRDFENSGDLISGAGDRGATNISRLQFAIDDTEALQAEAREEAIEDAKAKAKKLADDLGVRLVRMTGYWEGGNGGYPRMESAVMAMDSAGGGNFKSVPSMPAGEDSIVSQVSITYEIR